jgi:hypothetical protein
VIARTFPPDRVQQILAETGKTSRRERDLPAHVMVYYAIVLALYRGSSTREVMRCLLEGLRWLWGAKAVRVAGKSDRPPPGGPVRMLFRVGPGASGSVVGGTGRNCATGHAASAGTKTSGAGGR